MGLTERVTRGRMMMLDGTHLFPHGKPWSPAAAVEAALLNLASIARLSVCPRPRGARCPAACAPTAFDLLCHIHCACSVASFDRAIAPLPCPAHDARLCLVPDCSALRGGRRVAAVLALWLGVPAMQAQPRTIAPAACRRTAAGLQMLPLHPAGTAAITGYAAHPGHAGRARGRPIWLRLPLELAASAPVAGCWTSTTRRCSIDLVLASGGRVVQQAALGSHVPFAQRPLPPLARGWGWICNPAWPPRAAAARTDQGAMVLPLHMSPAMHAENALREQMLQACSGLALCPVDLQPGAVGQPARCCSC